MYDGTDRCIGFGDSIPDQHVRHLANSIGRVFLIPEGIDKDQAELVLRSDIG